MKVLIISHNPITNQNNMGKTFLSLFSCFDRQELCQLYIYPTLPSVDRCTSFYRVTDKEVLNSLIRFQKPGGEIDRALIRESRGLYENEKDEALYRNRKNKSALRRLFRDAIWSLSRWHSPALRRWLDREKPDCIFLAPGAAKFIYNIALKIAKERNIPIITYVCDEYYFVKKPDTALDRLRLGLLRRKIEAVMARSTRLVAICDPLKEVYSRHFGVEAVTLMTGTAFPVAQSARWERDPGAVCYFGNIRCNRYLSLADVGRALDAVNTKRGTDYRLKIYTGEKDAGILSVFDGIRSVELCGYVSGEEFDRAFHEAELLLHVEAFDEDSIDFVKHSVSTKIADSLAGGIPLLAYGPASVASMEHLLKNDCAICAVSPDALEEMLITAFTDGKARKTAAENALKVARDCHDGSRNSRMLKDIFRTLQEGSRA